MVREARDRIENILTECGVLVKEVIQVNLSEEGQGNIVPNESGLKPAESQAEPEEEQESIGLVMY